LLAGYREWTSGEGLLQVAGIDFLGNGSICGRNYRRDYNADDTDHQSPLKRG
jgi:hypothetical protein